MEVSKKLKANKATKNQSTKRSRRAAEWKQLNAVPEAPKDHKDNRKAFTTTSWSLRHATWWKKRVQNDHRGRTQTQKEAQND